MLDVARLCSLAVRAVYWLVVLACNFLGYSPVWVKNQWKQRQQEVFSRFDVDSFFQEYSRPQRIPSHLAVLFSDRRIQKNELLAFFDSCLTVGIRRVTLYDPWGDISRLADKLHIIARVNNVLVYSGCVPCPTNTDFRMLVQVLPSNCGLRSLVECCKILSTSSNEVTVSEVSSVLSDKLGIGEPDLLIQVGSTPSLAAYPPWALRITEFVQVQHLPFSRFQFEDCLVNFGKRDIRVGR